jgi:hypothetical protein
MTAKGQKQIPFGNDKRKGNDNKRARTRARQRDKSRFPSGMTNKRGTTTKGREPEQGKGIKADSLRE